MNFDASEICSAGLLARSKRILSKSGSAWSMYEITRSECNVREIICKGEWMAANCAIDLKLITPDQCLFVSRSILKRVAKDEFSAIVPFQRGAEAINTVCSLADEYENGDVVYTKLIDHARQCHAYLIDIDVARAAIIGRNARLTCLCNAAYATCCHIVSAAEHMYDPERFRISATYALRILFSYGGYGAVGTGYLEPELGQLKELVLSSVAADEKR